MDLTVPHSQLLDEASERMAHHWVDLEDFHYQIMRHTSKQTFRKIIIFVSEDVLRELRQLWVNNDNRVSTIKEHRQLPGYEYSYRLMPVLTDCHDGVPRFLTQGKYVVAYYNDMAELPTVAMSWQAPDSIRAAQAAREQQELDFDPMASDSEIDELDPVPTPPRKFANAADMYYNGSKPVQQPLVNPAQYYGNPQDRGSVADGWDPADYGGPNDK